MGKSFFERLARGLGRTTGKLVDKAKERGLDKKFKELAKEYEEGQNEAEAVEGRADSAETEETRAEETRAEQSGDSSVDEERSADVTVAGASESRSTGSEPSDEDREKREVKDE